MARETYLYSKQQLSVHCSLSITPKMRETLDRISQACKDEGGRYMDRSQILRALIVVLGEAKDGIDWTKITTERELQERLIDALARRR